jgi:N4-gp56 family major capsid protein
MANAQSLTSNVSQALKDRYYIELFLRTAENNLVHQQLGQLNLQVPKGENSGGVYWTRWTNLPLVTAGQGEGIPTTAVGLSAVNVTGTSAQYDAAVSLSDLFVRQAFGDVVKAGMQRLAYNAGLSIDTVVRNAIVNSGTSQLAGGATGSWTAINATSVFSITELRKAQRTLVKNSAFKVGAGLNAAAEDAADRGYWVAVISPDTAYDIYGDQTTGAWIDSNRYAGSERIFDGEIGKLYGTRFLETQNAYVNGTAPAQAASPYIHTTLVTGSDYFGVTNLQNLQTFIKDFGSAGTGDPTNKVMTLGWKTTFGTTVLNSAFAVSLANAVSS